MSWDRYPKLLLILSFLMALASSFIVVSNPGYFSHDELHLIERIKFMPFNEIFMFSFQGSDFMRPVARNIEILILSFTYTTPYLSHFFSVLIHAVNALIIFMILTRVTTDRYIPPLAGLLFMISPLSAFCVNWYMGMEDSIYVFFSLLSIFFYVIYTCNYGFKAWLYISLSGLCLACSLLSKETGIMTAGYIFILVIYLRKYKDFKYLAGLFVIGLVSLGYLVMRSKLLASLGGASGGGYGFVFSFENMLSNLTTYFAYPFYYRIVDSAGFTFHLTDIKYASIAGHVVILLLLLRNSLKGFLVYILLFILTLLPVLFISKNEGQYLYGTGVVFSGALAYIMINAVDRKSLVLSALMFIMVGVLTAHTFLIGGYYLKTGQVQNKVVSKMTEIATTDCAREKEASYKIYEAPGSWSWVLKRALHGVTKLYGCDKLNIEYVTTEDGADLIFDINNELKRGVN